MNTTSSPTLDYNALRKRISKWDHILFASLAVSVVGFTYLIGFHLSRVVEFILWLVLWFFLARASSVAAKHAIGVRCVHCRKVCNPVRCRHCAHDGMCERCAKEHFIVYHRRRV